MAIEWNDAMTTGVKEVDDAHKTLILWINKLNTAMKAGNGRQEVLTVLNFLENYAAKHFTHEEQCMNQYQCPVALANKKAHSEFFVYFSSMKKEIEQNGTTVKSVIEVSNALGDWLKSHIMKIDTNLVSCVKPN